MTELNHAHDIARTVATTVLDRDPGPLSAVDSLSHHVFLGPGVVVKVIGAGEHTRIEREIALAPFLPVGISAPLLVSGIHEGLRYACYSRVHGTAPGMDLPDADDRTARELAEQAVHRLGLLHTWVPGDEAAATLREPLGHGGFVSRAGLFALIENIREADENGAVAPELLDGLDRIAEGAPLHSDTVVPVHADCHWGNWLADGDRITALLDFEWARFGVPMDDWFFVIGNSGAHREAVLEVVARETGIAPELLRYECEVRHATHLASDILLASGVLGGRETGLLSARLRGLREIVVDRLWWH
ncbi:MAG TPA: phosphotransferase [Actinoplanes sp.]|nr:phosphotransferase [Actinoplanes sp.]